MIEAAIKTRIEAALTSASFTGYRVAPATEHAIFTSPLALLVQFNQVTGSRVESDQGASSLANATYQLDFVAATLREARHAADAVRIQLSAYRGTTDSTQILWMRFDSDRHGVTTQAPGADQGPARFSVDMSVHYRERSTL